MFATVALLVTLAFGGIMFASHHHHHDKKDRKEKHEKHEGDKKKRGKDMPLDQGTYEHEETHRHDADPRCPGGEYAGNERVEPWQSPDRGARSSLER